MADGQGTFGGGGSIMWNVAVAEGDAPEISKRKDRKRGYTVDGIDRHEKPSSDTSVDYFEVRIQPPAGQSIKLKTEGNGVVLYLPVSTSPMDQITVGWALKQGDVPTTAVEYEKVRTAIGGAAAV